MKKSIFVLAVVLSAVLFSCSKGELVVYGSCEEPYLAAACKNFEEITGVKTTFKRYSTGEVLSKIASENGAPSADIWFGGTTDPYNQVADLGLLQSYKAKNAKNLKSAQYKHEDGCWYGIYQGILGFFWNREELEKRGVMPPLDWDDLLDPSFKGLISFANPNTSGTGLLILNTLAQLKGEEAAKEYFSALDKNICQYTKSGAAPSKLVPTGEIVIGVGFLHDIVYQIVDKGYTNVGLTSPISGTSYEIGATAIFKGAKNLKNAKKFIEYALSPDCVNLAQENGSYQFLCIEGAKNVQVAVDAGLDQIVTMEYDFEDAAKNGEKYKEVFFSVIENDERVKNN